ncbi:transmembrane transcriptional regulator (anti-sigma factor) [Caballeronia udeis]|uniref:Transmembrane transcriptional regulator (Anti-sigma factor) n=1 Tax=Caballeronia udeis TaxID=1232866 RepID=A0A158FY69_9BURK|nr:anti-sigma factor [Caballeronia udeis]SAL24309.1 transmembrane transcriptional regulator (anti-sigma factor) [Caballeronia udeis]
METKPNSSLADKLRDGSLYERAPASLRAQVQARLKAETVKEAKQKPSPWNWSWRMAGVPFIGGGVAGIALCSMVFMTLLWTQQAPRGGDLQQEIVSSHVRALMSARTMDVLSSDQHTVKPWFNGRIDYAPPVVDPQAEGFPLVGGRLDYVDHRPVAVMIYRYLKHPIDLYVFPDDHGKSAPSSTPLVTQSDDGYSLVEWHQDGMVYWAISDASPVYIKRFAEAIKAGTRQ